MQTANLNPDHSEMYQFQLKVLLYEACDVIFYQFEEAAREMADEVTKPRPIGEEDVQDIQVTFRSEANSMGLRDLKVS